jgi:hypothetical protein
MFTFLYLTIHKICVYYIISGFTSIKVISSTNNYTNIWTFMLIETVLYYTVHILSAIFLFFIKYFVYLKLFKKGGIGIE